MNFTKSETFIKQIYVISFSYDSKRSCLATKILKIHAVGKKCQIGTSWKIATIILSQWLFFKRCQFGTFFLLHRFSKFLWLNYFFLIHLKYSSHILVEKVHSIQENPKFSITKTVNCNFLILPSTEFDFFNFSSFLTFTMIPGNQN